MFKLKLVFELCNLLLSFFKVDFFLSRDSRKRICFKMPTRSSSTLCWMPLDVSMNLQSLATARALPSAEKCEENVCTFYRGNNLITHHLDLSLELLLSQPYFPLL